MRKPTKKSLKAEAEFNAGVAKMLLDAGAVPHTGGRDGALRIETTIGALEVTPYGTWLAARFLTKEGMDEAVARFGSSFGSGEVNHYSGKWNVMMSHDMEVVDRLRTVQRHLSRVIPELPAIANEPGPAGLKKLLRF